LESELFGIGEGVATGVAANRGRIQQAQGGTLVLDEIGDMSPDLQAKLLRALQEKEIHPVGRKPVSIDVRVLASTNQNLTRRIESGHFRSDLYYRLAGYVLELPPLRQRPEDIPALVEHFLRACSRELDRPIRGITVRALRWLSTYPWPGNIRELANEVRRAVYLCPIEGTIESSSLSSAVISHHESREVPSLKTDGASTTARNPSSDAVPPLPGPMGLGLDSLNLASLERQAVEEAMRRCHNNQVQAAKLLGITRQSLRRRLERWSGD
jgi:transcriptional regulator with PAS, ATPase and Fis domain